MRRALVLAAVVAFAGPIMLLGLAFAGGGGDTGARWCPTSSAQLPGLDGEQSQHAQTIAAVGDRTSVPTRGIVVALATAATESSLRNLNHGDRDSLGLFQQRAAWGTAKERTTPAIAATMFFSGGQGGQPGLLDIPGWEEMRITDAAQAVQRSAHPDAYAEWEDDAWVWLATLRGTHSSDARPECGGNREPDGGDPPPIVENINTLKARAQAFADASAAGQPDPFYGATNYYLLCARLAARVHGHAHAGFATALEQWQHYVGAGIAVTDGSPPPPGALLFYTNEPWGHVAVYLGDDTIISNDVLDNKTGRHGGVYIVDDTELTDGAWSLPYAGWAPPNY